MFILYFEICWEFFTFDPQSKNSKIKLAMGSHPLSLKSNHFYCKNGYDS